jgi:dTDP-4-dehydrorhamnose 3,5-epimerase
MLCEKTPIDGAYVINFKKIEDNRGYFSRVYGRDELSDCGVNMEVVQANMSGNLFKDTLRGLHFQAHPAEEDKLVRVVEGSIFDVAVDMRKNSPSYGRWHAVELSRENWRGFFIPKGCAHGYYTTEDNSQVLYFVSHPYTPNLEGGIAWNDPVLAIKWPGTPRYMSEKDAAWPAYSWKR